MEMLPIYVAKTTIRVPYSSIFEPSNLIRGGEKKREEDSKQYWVKFYFTKKNTASKFVSELVSHGKTL